MRKNFNELINKLDNFAKLYDVDERQKRFQLTKKYATYVYDKIKKYLPSYIIKHNTIGREDNVGGMPCYEVILKNKEFVSYGKVSSFMISEDDDEFKSGGIIVEIVAPGYYDSYIKTQTIRTKDITNNAFKIRVDNFILKVIDALKKAKITKQTKISYSNRSSSYFSEFINRLDNLTNFADNDYIYVSADVYINAEKNGRYCFKIKKDKYDKNKLINFINNKLGDLTVDIEVISKESYEEGKPTSITKEHDLVRNVPLDGVEGAYVYYTYYN